MEWLTTTAWTQVAYSSCLTNSNSIKLKLVTFHHQSDRHLIIDRCLCCPVCCICCVVSVCQLTRLIFNNFHRSSPRYTRFLPSYRRIVTVQCFIHSYAYPTVMFSFHTPCHAFINPTATKLSCVKQASSSCDRWFAISLGLCACAGQLFPVL